MKKIILVFFLFLVSNFLTVEAICLTRLAKSEKPISEFLKKENDGLYSLTLIQLNGKRKKKQYFLKNGKFVSPKSQKQEIEVNIKKDRYLEICYAKKGKCFQFCAKFSEDWEKFNYKISGGGFFVELYLFLKGYKSGAGIVQYDGNDEFWLLNNDIVLHFHYCETGELESIAVKITAEKQASDDEI